LIVLTSPHFFQAKQSSPAGVEFGHPVPAFLTWLLEQIVLVAET
jgi:hypothetical protein